MHNINLQNLAKDFQTGFKLGPINYEFKAGLITVVLGKNGAGKSTCFQLITGSLDASSGEVRLGNERMIPENFDLKKRLGYLPQNLNLPKWSSGAELLKYSCKMRQVNDIEAKIKHWACYWDCNEYLNKAIGSCSYGMTKRIGLALASIHEPEYLILDEPSSGLDIYHIKALDDYLSQRKQSGLATVLSTHDAHHAAKNGDHAVIMENGSMMPIANWEQQNILTRIQTIENAFFGKTA